MHGERERERNKFARVYICAMYRFLNTHHVINYVCVHAEANLK